jgi:hypothetical protein
VTIFSPSSTRASKASSTVTSSDIKMLPTSND